MRAARWLGVPPWGDATKGLSQVSVCWRTWGLICDELEQEHQMELMRNMFGA